MSSLMFLISFPAKHFAQYYKASPNKKRAIINFIYRFNKTSLHDFVWWHNSFDIGRSTIDFIFTILHWVHNLNLIFLLYFWAFAGKQFETSVRKYIIMIINVWADSQGTLFLCGTQFLHVHTRISFQYMPVYINKIDWH